jgi:hypothetical protein
MTTPTQHDARQQVLQALELPALDGLTAEQVRGAVCVWDGVILTPETAVDLGPRKKRRLDGAFNWFPRGCTRCVADAAYRALVAHAGDCEACRKGPECPFSVAVTRLMREGR